MATYAEFARTKGAKDKQKRKSRAGRAYDSARDTLSRSAGNAYASAVEGAGGLYAKAKSRQVRDGARRAYNQGRESYESNKGKIAGGLAGAGALAGGIRYGGEALKYRGADKRGFGDRFTKKKYSIADQAVIDRGGAKGQVMRDLVNLRGKTLLDIATRAGGGLAATAATLAYLKNRSNKKKKAMAQEAQDRYSRSIRGRASALKGRASGALSSARNSASSAVANVRGRASALRSRLRPQTEE